MPYATYRFNKIIAAETIRFIVTVAIVVYKGLKLVVYRMLTTNECITEVGGTPINLNPSECWLWSSTEVEGQKENKAWLHSLQSGTIQETPKNQEHKFRPIISIYKH